MGEVFHNMVCSGCNMVAVEWQLEEAYVSTSVVMSEHFLMLGFDLKKKKSILALDISVHLSVCLDLL